MKSQILNTDDLVDFDVYEVQSPKKVNQFANCKFVFRQGGFDPETHKGLSVEQILELESTKWFSNRDGFYGYFVNKTHLERNWCLLALYDWDDEYYGCRHAKVIGHLLGYDFTSLGLGRSYDSMASHKVNCWFRKYDSCKDLLDYSRPKEFKLKIAKELGWKNGDDLIGIANFCDCGYNEIRK